MRMDVIVHSDGYKEGVMRDFEYPMTAVKRYHHSIFKLINLTGCDRVFLDWLTEVMGADNSVYINDDEINRFIATLATSGTVYKLSSIKQTVKRLRSLGLLLKTKKASGLFHVCPLFYSKSSESKRWETIKMLLEFDVDSDKETNEWRIKIYEEMKRGKK